MIKVTYQRHGSPEVLEMVFQNVITADVWLNLNMEMLSFAAVVEIFH
jgi:hypothetical protein